MSSCGSDRVPCSWTGLWKDTFTELSLNSVLHVVCSVGQAQSRTRHVNSYIVCDVSFVMYTGAGPWCTQFSTVLYDSSLTLYITENSLSVLTFNGHFSSWAWVNQSQNVSPSGLELWIMEVVVTTLQSCSQILTTNKPALYRLNVLDVDRPIH